MINKKRYIEILTQLLSDHYAEVKRKSNGAKDSKQYIIGYLTAARALSVFDYEELKVAIDMIHLKAFGKTIEESQKSELCETSSDDDLLDIPTFIREGINLDKG